MHTPTLIFLFAWVFPHFAGAQGFRHLSYGPHDVGFQSVLETDFSRPSRNNPQLGRAVQVNFWYPAVPGKESVMTFNDYLYLEGEEDSTAGTEARATTVERFLEYPASEGANMEAWKSFLAKKNPMKGKRSAPFKYGEYPVVMLVHGSALQYAQMGEYLASHGMIVVNTPYKGYRQNTFDVSVLGMETEMRDMEFALDALVRRLKVRPAGIGIVGLSFGGQSAVGLAVRNPLVRCVVSLDGGIGSTFGPQLLDAHPFYTIEKVNMPILHIYNPADAGGNIDWFDVCEYTDRYLVSLKNMDHAFFGIFGSLDNSIPHVLGPSKPRPGDNSEAILLYTRTFLSMAFTDNLQNPEMISALGKQYPWLSDCIESSTFRKKALSPLPLDYWQKVLASRGIDGLIDAHQKVKQDNAFPISNPSYRTLFLESFNRQDKPAMSGISEMFATDFPQSALAKYYQGRSAQLNTQTDKAKSFFNQSLSLLDADTSMTTAEKAAVKTRIESFLK